MIGHIGAQMMWPSPRRRLRQWRTALDWSLWFDRQIAATRPAFDPKLEDVFLRRGLVLIHIPKNAGTTVEASLFGHPVRHRPWHELARDYPKAWAKCTSLAMTRHPMDRFLSAFDYLAAGGRNAADRAFAAQIVAGRTPSQLLSKMMRNRRFRRRAMAYFHFRPQVDYVVDGGEVMVDYLIPLDHLAAGLERVCGVDPDRLTRENRTLSTRTPPSVLTPADHGALTTLYRADYWLHERALAAPWLTTCAAATSSNPHVPPQNVREAL